MAASSKCRAAPNAARSRRRSSTRCSPRRRSRWRASSSCRRAPSRRAPRAPRAPNLPLRASVETDVAADRGALVLLLATHNPKKLAELERILQRELNAADTSAPNRGGPTFHLLGLDLYPDVATAPEE